MKVMFSYARESVKFVEWLDGKLQRNNIKAWLDTRDIAGGAKWREEIYDAIKETDVVILCLSIGEPIGYVNSIGFIAMITTT